MPEALTPAPKPRLLPLSGLKALAVIGVIACHTGALPQWDLCARMVEMLFLLSGFCMAYNHGDALTDGSFYDGWRTVWRKLPQIYPIHLATFLLQLFFVAKWAAKPLGFTLSFGLLNLALLQAWFPKTQFMFNNVSWFLSALAFCYFVTPALTAAARQAKETGKLWLMFAILAAVRLYLEYMRLTYPMELWYDLHTNPLIQSLNYSLGFVAGIYFTGKSAFNAFWRERLSVMQVSWLEILLTGLYLACCYALARDMYRLFFVMAALPMIYILAGGRGLLARLLALRPLVWLSAFNLEIFMLHSFILYYYPVQPGDLWYYVKFSGLVLGAAIIFRLAYRGLCQAARRMYGFYRGRKQTPKRVA